MAIAAGWPAPPSRPAGRSASSRTAPARANEPGGTAPARPRRPALHPDQEAALSEIADRFGPALGREVDVTATAGGYRVHLSFESAEDALALGRSLRLSHE